MNAASSSRWPDGSSRVRRSAIPSRRAAAVAAAVATTASWLSRRRPTSTWTVLPAAAPSPAARPSCQRPLFSTANAAPPLRQPAPRSTPGRAVDAPPRCPAGLCSSAAVQSGSHPKGEPHQLTDAVGVHHGHRDLADLRPKALPCRVVSTISLRLTWASSSSMRARARPGPSRPSPGTYPVPEVSINPPSRQIASDFSASSELRAPPACATTSSSGQR